MNKTEWNTFLTELKNEYKKNGILSKQSQDQLTKNKKIAIKEGFITSKDLNEIAEMNVQVTQSNQTNKKELQMNFSGRGPRGPQGLLGGEKAKNSKGTLVRLMSYFKSESKIVITLFITIIVSVVCQVITPRLQSNAIDLVDGGLFEKLPMILLMMIIMFIIVSIFNLVQGLVSAKLYQNIVLKMRNDLFKKIINLPISYFDNNSHGDIMSRMTNDVDNISNTLAQSLGSLFAGILTIIGTVIMMTITCWQLAILSMVIVILTLLVTKVLTKAM